MKTGHQIFRANLIHIVGFMIVYLIISTIIAINDTSLFENIAKTVGKNIISIPILLLYTSIFWIPCILVAWALNYIFLIELEYNKYIVAGFECLFFGIPIIWLWYDNYSAMSKDLNLFYPLLMVSVISTQGIKINYLSKKGLLK